MKAHFESVTTLSSALMLTLATGCWTPDAHDQEVDASVLDVSTLCGLAKSRCYAFAQLPASGTFVDLSADSGGTCGAAFMVSSTFFSSIGFWFSPGPDPDAGILNGVSLQQSDPSNPSSPCHLKGTIPGAASWGFYLNMPTSNLCTDGSAQGGGLDASNFDGVTITMGGNAGPPGQMTFTVDSVGTPEDPYRQQELQTVITVPSDANNPTTYNFNWSELTAKCGNATDFQPGRIVGVGGSFLALAGIAYDFDVEISTIGFIPKSQ